MYELELNLVTTSIRELLLDVIIIRGIHCGLIDSGWHSEGISYVQ